MNRKDIKKEIRRIKKELNSAAGLNAVILENEIESLKIIEEMRK